MTVRGLFVSGDGRPRAGWRIAVFLVLFTVIGLVFTTIIGPLESITRWSGVGDAGGEVTLLLSIIATHAVMLRWVDRRPWSSVWLGTGAARPRLFGFGFALGALPILAASLVLLAVHWLSIEPAAAGSWVGSAVRMSAVLLPSALFEELTSRGYVFAALRDGLGAPVAVGTTSLGFGLLHLGNSGATAQSIVLVTLAGVFLAAVVLATQSLYAAWAAHFAWNWVMAVPLHVSVSGVAVPRPGYQTVDTGPDWATGGPWGPEGGAFAAAAMLAGLAWLYVRHRSAQRKTQNA